MVNVHCEVIISLELYLNLKGNVHSSSLGLAESQVQSPLWLTESCNNTGDLCLTISNHADSVDL